MSRAPFLTAAEAAELDLLKLSRTGPVHFMGICGAGMSALAEYVVRAGGQATGCDAKPASLTPARFLGLDHERGALVAGARADGEDAVLPRADRHRQRPRRRAACDQPELALAVPHVVRLRQRALARPARLAPVLDLMVGTADTVATETVVNWPAWHGLTALP